jgi:hypothetical protein
VAFWRLLGLVAVGLGLVALRGCERYTQEYNTLPMLDFVESMPAASEAERIPPAADLALRLGEVAPSLPLRQAPTPFIPQVAPPGRSQRAASGVRDAARVAFGTVPTAAASDAEGTTLSLGVVVFYNSVRANAWYELLTREMDIRDPGSGALQLRAGGPEQADRVWITHPREVSARTGEATVIGTRGPVLFQLQARLRRPNATSQEARLALGARAEVLARQAAAEWSAALPS